MQNRRLKVTYTVVNDVEEEILNINEVKLFLELDFPDFDEVIDLLIGAARCEVEKYTGLSIGQRTIQLGGDWEEPDMYLPFAPVISTNPEGLQVVGYTAKTIPPDLKLGIFNMIKQAFTVRGTDMSDLLYLVSQHRRRVGL